MNPINSFLRKISLLFAAAAAILTTTQLFLLILDKQTICFNDGCEIVETFTTIPSSTFNLFGLLYFSFVFWTLYLSKDTKDSWAKLHNLLLFAGLAAEGVLVGFQHFVIDTFCSYCLIVLAFVVLLNILRGIGHLITGASIFAAVLIGFASLSFTTTEVSSDIDLSTGSIAAVSEDSNGKNLYFFFSSTCKHCEEVLELLEANPQCSISFNPIDPIQAFDAAGLTANDQYSPEVNRSFLSHYGVSEIPALFIKDDRGFAMVTSKTEIIDTILEQCYPEPIEEILNQQGTTEEQPLFPEPVPEEGNCTIETDCEDVIPPQE